LYEQYFLLLYSLSFLFTRIVRTEDIVKWLIKCFESTHAHILIWLRFLYFVIHNLLQVIEFRKFLNFVLIHDLSNLKNWWLWLYWNLNMWVIVTNFVRVLDSRANNQDALGLADQNWVICYMMPISFTCIVSIQCSYKFTTMIGSFCLINLKRKSFFPNSSLKF
jgi:hypothetical protein